MQKKGNVVVEGIVIGKIQFMNADYEERIKSYTAGSKEEEKEKYQKAHSFAKADLDEMLSRREELSESEVEILEVHQMLLDDITLETAVLGYLEEGNTAPLAVLKAVADFKAMFEEIEDDYLRERQKDIIDIGNRLLRKILNMKEFSVEGENVVLCAKEIEPSIMAGLSERQVKAILLESGSRTSHSIIIAKAKGFVTMVGVELSRDEIDDGDDIIVDAVKGKILLKPDVKMLEEYRQLHEEQEREREYLMGRAQMPAKTQDGKEILVAANISGADDMEKASAFGCRGVGLFRTEFLFMESSTLPSEDKQFEAYKAVLSKMGGKKVIIRTLDIGADKQADYFNIEKEENPALGFRAIRICLERVDMFKTQLRAIYRASAYGKAAIMFPMIISVSEIVRIKEIVEEVKEELRQNDIPFGDVELGIMIETPAAVIISDQLAAHVEFFSIGTNDLTQYTLAIDRQNQALEPFYNAHHEAVLRMIQMTIENAHAHGAWCGICGELGADMELTRRFVQMGIDELSVSPPFTLELRQKIREID